MNARGCRWEGTGLGFMFVLLALMPPAAAFARPGPAGDSLQHAWRILVEGKEVGRGLLKTDRGDHAVVMEDSYEVTSEGGKLSVKVRQECSGATSLTPRCILLEESRGKAVRACEALFNKGLMTVVEGEDAVTSAVSPSPVTCFALFRLIPVQAQKDGATFAFDFLDTNGFVCKPKQKLVCTAVETKSGKDKLWQWKPVDDYLGPFCFWVEGDHVSKAVIGPQEWVFTGKQ